MKLLYFIGFCSCAGLLVSSIYPDAGSKTGYKSTKTDPSAALDEAMGGETLRGTPVTKRTPECFPAEQRDLFYEMDQIVGADGELHPINFDKDGDGKISDMERNAIRGRNTWLLWGGGNETFWGWLQEQGYGLNDFLILLDSRNREHRFRDAGLINQPGFKQNTTRRVLGLYLDEPDGTNAKLKQPPSEIDPTTGKPTVHRVYPPDDPTHKQPLFKEAQDPLAQQMLKEARDWLYAVDDGLDPTVYGYPSGIFGLRLMLNPDFFADTKDAARARQYWNERVAVPKHNNYYTEVSVHADPQLIRPFRVTMSCGFCHVGPHPLNPPPNPEHPEWKNLSSTIGDQFWKPQSAFANLLPRTNFLHHFLNSQQPGTIDTSLVSTDWINNSNTINAIFDVPARLQRAANNSPEHQSAANLLVPSVEEGDASINPRHFPRVLLDGADSCGVFAAMIRVPLNIGTYFEEWRRTGNPIIGFATRRPFRIAACRANSVYWQTNERYRIPYEIAFFNYKNDVTGEKSTTPMRLEDAGPVLGTDGRPTRDGNGKVQTLGRQLLATDSPNKRTMGRAAFIQHCAICHSSKQPEGFQLEFARDIAQGWDRAPKPSAAAHYTLPMDFAQWEAFKKSESYQDYVTKIKALAGEAPIPGTEDPFIKDNFLSNEVRIPVSLVGTNPGRATATNGLAGEVWDNFSSDDYKKLPAVGALRFFNPFSGAAPDAYGNNDAYPEKGDGRGYYRPASLISLWATAPYLHNNALGLYSHDPSVEGRLKAYQDGIEKLLWKNKRARDSNPRVTNRPEGSVHDGDLRADGTRAAANDTGYIYRLPVDTHIYMAPPFIRPLVSGILGAFWTEVLSTWIWILLFVGLVALVWRGNPRHAIVLFFLLAILAGLLLWILGSPGLLSGALWLIPVILFLIGALVYFWRDKAHPQLPTLGSRIVFGALAAVIGFVGFFAHQFVNGRLGALNLGPIPRGTPVNLIMNMDPDGPGLFKGLIGLTRGIIKVRVNHSTGDKAYQDFISEAGTPLMHASKCPDFVLDRGHYFGEGLSDEEKNALIAFLKTL